MPESPTATGVVLSPAMSGSASLSERQATENKFEMPQWGRPITPAEIITMMLQREGTREEALDMLAMTLADLGITGEEIGHWQNKPGICHDCNVTGDHHEWVWKYKLKTFPQDPFEYGGTYWKKDGPSGRNYRQNGKSPDAGAKEMKS